MLKKSAFGIALFYTVILAVVSFISISGIPDFNYSSTDKIYHFIAYSLLSWLWFKVFFKKLKWHFNKSLIYAAIVSVLFGIIIEVLQGKLTNTRVAENNDVLANVLGVSLTIVILLLFKKIRNR